MLELPDILRALSPEQIDTMQRRVVFVFENFLASLAHQIYTAFESIRINMYSGKQRENERRKLLAAGLPHSVPEHLAQTPAAVQSDSRNCNAPAHRRKEAKDGAVM
jgi:hypothetical protein